MGHGSSLSPSTPRHHQNERQTDHWTAALIAHWLRQGEIEDSGGSNNALVLQQCRKLDIELIPVFLTLRGRHAPGTYFVRTSRWPSMRSLQTVLVRSPQVFMRSP